MEWFLLEALVALFIAIAIVWWTTGVRRKPQAKGDAEARRDRQ